MRLDEEESGNVEDRRGIGVGAGGIGIGTVVLALAASYFFGIDPSVILGLRDSVAPPTQQQSPTQQGPHDDGRIFVGKVLRTTETAWGDIFQKAGKTYQKPTLVLFSGGTQTACGLGRTAMGPFYCPGDQKVYIDLKFYEDLKTRFHAPGDFAEAYVIAHEVGHHVQNLLGITQRVDSQRERLSRPEFNKISVRVELQADCLAGVWAHHYDETKHFLEKGDVEEALNAATAIGDDRLQEQARGYAVPDTFTHGTSAQRVRWFKTGMETGNVNACDTFAVAQL